MVHFKRLLAACLITVPYILAVQNAVVGTSVGNTTLESQLVTDWGSWGPWEYCPAGTFVIGMQLKTLPYQGRFRDDSGLNAVRFYCAPVGGNIDPNNPTHITSSVGPYGRHGRKFSCDGPATGFQLRSKSAEWFTDETAASNLRLYCDGIYHEGDGVDRGYWTGPKICPKQSAICGLRTQIEPQSVDVTALNNIKVQCCPVPNPAIECRPKDSWDLLLACDNLEATTPITCTYEKRIGTSHWNKVSYNQHLLYEMYSNIGFTLPGAIIDLPGNFGLNLNQSLVTGYNWTSSSSEMWKEETSVNLKIDVPAGTRMTLHQVYGTCDFYSVRANMFKITDYNTTSNTERVTTFSFMGNTPVTITQAPDNVHPANDVSLRTSRIAPTEEPLPVNGTVLRGEFPHQVALGSSALRRPGFYASCGASIIHPFLLLTAAHCLAGKRPRDIQAIAGEHQQTISDRTEQFLYIQSFIIHPDFNLNSLRNDIAIIALQHPVIPSPYVQIINIPEPGQPLPVRAQVSGWGGPGNNSDILQKAWLNFVDACTCEEETGETLYKEICAGGNRDTCKGDSGGPLTCENPRGERYLCGITSWGDDCEDKLTDPQLTVPGVFIDVREHYDWIRSHMRVWWRHYWNTLLGQPLSVRGDCEAGRFKCANSGLCLPDRLRCDGVNDCAPYGDGSDERNCPNVACPAGSVACEGTGRCVAEEHICDELDYGGVGSRAEYDYEGQSPSPVVTSASSQDKFESFNLSFHPAQQITGAYLHKEMHISRFAAPKTSDLVSVGKGPLYDANITAQERRLNLSPTKLTSMSFYIVISTSQPQHE